MTATIVPGTRIERYCVDSVIGAGSMGDVYLAVDQDLGRKVALKILSERHRDNEELRARFTREARAVAAISHPNVVQVFTTGIFDDLPYLAMEFLAGIDLGSSVRENGRWSSPRAARAVLDSARGLDAAAKAGLIHRDVKPSNLVLLAAGGVKVTDFGLAKPLDPGSEPALTAHGVVVGTPDYIAPEQARGDAIDERVDIYALGGTLYFLLCGQPPYRTGRKDDDKYLKVVARHLRAPIPDPRSVDPSIDGELAQLGQRMMAKKPVDRPGYAELIEQVVVMVDRLDRTPTPAPIRPVSQPGRPNPEPTPFVGGLGPRGIDLAAGDSDEEAPTRVRMPTLVPGEESAITRRPGSSRWLVAITVLSALVFLAGLGLFLFGPLPKPHAGVVAPPVPRPDAAVPTALPLAPPGMLLVQTEDGRPSFVAIAPVGYDDFAAHFPTRKKPGKKPNLAPVTGVSFADAAAYAEAKAHRLVRGDEWSVAATTAGFASPAGNLWEWIDDGAAGNDRAVARGSEHGRRPAKGHKDVTFRLARDP